MPTAYVLLNCELGHENEIINELKKLPGIVDVEGSYGVYDMIVKISADTMDKLKETITWHVRKIDKIKSTLTLIVIEGQGSWINSLSGLDQNWIYSMLKRDLKLDTTD